MNKWKLVAIIFLILFILENILIGWGIYLNTEEEKKSYECLYEVCNNYLEAEYTSPVCTCYDKDVLGNFVVKKQEYMK